MSKLLIVESPTKARTIGRMLGKEYQIIASMGHIRDLPEHAFGIDIENRFTPEYVDTPRSRTTLKELRAAAAKADEIYLATDPDREGEAIAWHLQNALTESLKRPVPFHRVTFHEITRQAIEQAIADKGEVDLRLVDAQQARRVLDRIVGYQVSPLLWRKLEKGSSAGRVQSVALRMIVERERAITAFVPEEFWNFTLQLANAEKESFRTRLFKIDGKDFRIPDEAGADAAETAIREGQPPVTGQVTAQERHRNPYPPFTTSTLQQAANLTLHFSATNTMRYAQQLYEGVDVGGGDAVGLITYMRTDSVTVAKEAQIAAKEFITGAFGPEYLPGKFNFYKNKAAAQEAHEAIRPTDVRRTPELMAPYLDAQQLKLYTLIWKRFVASQMIPAKQELITVDVRIAGKDGKEYLFRATNTVTLFPGFLKLTQEAKTEKEDCRPETLKALREGETLRIEALEKEKKFTEPPARFTEAALIKQLEENGIGRPSTYATILRTIQDRDYVARAQGKLVPTELGFSVNDFLVEKLPELFDIGFTAKMEQQLDDVEAGSIQWVDMMSDFYARFSPWVAGAKESGAPPPERAKAIIALLDSVSFAPAKKVGARTFDDKKFYHSVKEKFEKTGKLSEKQFLALIQLAARYSDQLSLETVPEEIRTVISQAQQTMAEQAEKLRQRPAAPAGSGYLPVFSAFDNVTFAAPRGKGRFAFDEGKFFRSLQQQAAAGTAFSEKQLAALKRLVLRYQHQLTEPEKVFAALQMDKETVPAATPAESEAAAAPAADSSRIQGLLAKLSQVQEWAPASKRGRFSFDDKKFYLSLARQFEEKHLLSEKQTAALEKLAAKYEKEK